MSIRQQINDDLKIAMLARDKETTEALRTIKSAILYEEVRLGKREEGLDDATSVTVLQKEAKKRQESADLYNQAEAKDRADKELFEKSIIAKYLPDQIGEEELHELVVSVVQSYGTLDQKAMGAIIGQVKAKAIGADGALIARLVKEAISS